MNIETGRCLGDGLHKLEQMDVPEELAPGTYAVVDAGRVRVVARLDRPTPVDDLRTELTREAQAAKRREIAAELEGES